MEKYGILVIHLILLILTLFAVQSSQETRQPNLVKSMSSARNLQKKNIDDQLKTIREEKHKVYLHNAGCKSPLLENNKKNENQKQCDNLQDRNVDKKQPKETNNNSLWSSGTCVIVGDSMVNGIDKKRLPKKDGNVKVF